MHLLVSKIFILEVVFSRMPLAHRSRPGDEENVTGVVTDAKANAIRHHARFAVEPQGPHDGTFAPKIWLKGHSFVKQLRVFIKSTALSGTAVDIILFDEILHGDPDRDVWVQSATYSLAEFVREASCSSIKQLTSLESPSIADGVGCLIDILCLEPRQLQDLGKMQVVIEDNLALETISTDEHINAFYQLRNRALQNIRNRHGEPIVFEYIKNGEVVSSDNLETDVFEKEWPIIQAKKRRSLFK
mmetsp:Transcript_16184/g.29135  ORF Transcript_16184/g.29135 Transcript_16184/m.29135 type:complete len:244 (+) Transcript_16184:55-786(+)